MVGSLVLLSVVVASGVGLTYWLPLRLRVEERVAVGAVLGIVAFCAVAFAAFELMGMGWPTVVAGAGVPAVAGCVGWRRHRGGVVWRRSRTTIPFALTTLVAAAAAGRTLAIAYPSTRAGTGAGHLAVFGDWSAHLAYAGSFAYGDNRGLQSPIAAGTPLRYHFLCDFFAAPFTVVGASLTQALTLTTWALAVALVPLFMSMVMRLTRSRATSVGALLLFTLAGGSGWWYFLVDAKADGWRVLANLPRSYSRMPDQDIWFDNTISMSLYAQRSTQFGLCIGLAAMVLLLAARVTWRRSVFGLAGVMVGLTGIVFAHLLLTALALATLAAAAERRSGHWREWVAFAAPAALLGLPMLWAISPQEGSVRWLVGWMAPDAHQSWLWFWLRNAGLFLPLFALAMLPRVARPRLRRLSTPLWLWFVVPNLVAFHPWPGNNIKFFLFWQIAGAVVLADVLTRAVRARWRWRGRLVEYGAVAVFVLLVAAGSLDTLRSWQRSSASEWVAADDMALAGWLREHAEPGDVLAYGATNTSAVAALSGVPVVSGYPGWTLDLGLPDWRQRQQDSHRILAGTPDTAALVERYGVVWVAIGPDERESNGASDTYWELHGDLVAEAGEYRIYRVRAAGKP